MTEERKDVRQDATDLSRRKFLVIGGALGGVAAGGAALAAMGGDPSGVDVPIKASLPWQDGMADAPADSVGDSFKFLTPAEMDFVTAAADRLIPPDETGPSASEAGVPTFIDRQLAGGYGRGDHFYLGGPWPKGEPGQGYQSRFSPSQLYRHAIPAIETVVGREHAGKTFKTLDATFQDELLKRLEKGEVALEGVDVKTFFGMFLQNVREGYFSDPIYGGNRDMAAWKMIGFPGARYDYTDWVKRHGEKYPLGPVGLRGRRAWSEA